MASCLAGVASLSLCGKANWRRPSTSPSPQLGILGHADAFDQRTLRAKIDNHCARNQLPLGLGVGVDAPRCPSLRQLGSLTLPLRKRGRATALATTVKSARFWRGSSSDAGADPHEAADHQRRPITASSRPQPRARLFCACSSSRFASDAAQSQASSCARLFTRAKWTRRTRWPSSQCPTSSIGGPPAFSFQRPATVGAPGQ